MQKVVAHDFELYDVWEGRYTHTGRFAHFTGIFTDANGQRFKNGEGAVDVLVELAPDWPRRRSEKEMLVELTFIAWFLDTSDDSEEFAGPGLNLDVTHVSGDTYQVYDWCCEDREEREMGHSYYEETNHSRFTFTSPIEYVNA